MPEELVYYITRYGYIAIFVILFLQEVGIPNPIPVELLLIFTGYLSFKGILYLPFVIITAITADFIGANILYFIFYASGTFLIQKKPRWIPISEKKIIRFKEKIDNGGWLSIYLFRLISLTRGYASVVTGLLHIKPRIYLPIVIISAFTWTMVYAILGFILGPSWNIIVKNIDQFKFVMFGIMLIIICISIFIWLRKKQIIQKKNKADINPY
jgi:membrane protein DedA with SNARE-associated domain